MDKLLKSVKTMLECGELRVVIEDFDTNFEGTTIENNGQNVIVLNSKLSYETQQKKFLHEIKHLSHIKSDMCVQDCENEAIEYSNDVDVFNMLLSYN
jgi:uncharacterized Fe-S center protein